MNTTENPNTLHQEIPPQADIEAYLTDYFKTNHEPHYISRINEVVAAFFGVSTPAVNLKLEVLGRTGHGNTATFLDTITGFAVMELHNRKLVKRIAPNTFESIAGPDKAISEPRAPKVRVSKRLVDEIVVMVKILQRVKKFQDNKTEIFCALCEKYDDANALEIAIDQVLTPA